MSSTLYVYYFIGPLINSQGSVIGINTMIISTSGSFAGIGFAIPIDSIRKGVDKIINEDIMKYPYLIKRIPRCSASGLIR